MQAVGRSVLTRGGRVVVATAGLMVLLALQPESVRQEAPAAAGLAPGATAGRTLTRPDQPRRVDAMMCGDEVVWIARNMVQKQVPLTDQSKRANVAREQQRGNRVHSGSASRTGVDE